MPKKKIQVCLAEVATAHEMNQTTLIDKSGLNPKTVRSWWKGYLDRLDLEVWETLAETLGVHPFDLLVYTNGGKND